MVCLAIQIFKDVNSHVSIVPWVMGVYHWEGVKGFHVGRGLQLEENRHCVTQQVDQRAGDAYEPDGGTTYEADGTGCPVISVFYAGVDRTGV